MTRELYRYGRYAGRPAGVMEDTQVGLRAFWKTCLAALNRYGPQAGGAGTNAAGSVATALTGNTVNSTRLNRRVSYDVDAKNYSVAPSH